MNAREAPARLPQYPTNSFCDSVTNKYDLSFVSGTGGPWNKPGDPSDDTDQAEALAGARSWEVARNGGGNTLVTVDRAGATKIVQFRRGWPTPKDHIGEADPDHDNDGHSDHVSFADINECEFIQLSTMPGADHLRRSASHEMGHIIGLRHTGKLDTRQIGTAYGDGTYDTTTEGWPPLMQGNCSNVPDQVGNHGWGDDWASLFHSRYSSMMTADFGFESLPLVSTRVWRGPVSIMTTMPYAGDKYARIASGGVLSQRVRVRDAGLFDSDSVRVTGAYKSGGTGSINFKLYGRRILRYTNWECTDPQYVGSYPSSWSQGAIQIAWTGVTDPDGEGDWEVFNPSFTGFATNHGEFEIRVVNLSGEDAYVDNVRGERQ